MCGMSTRIASPTIAQHFAGRAPAVRAIYDELIKAARSLGPFEQDPKKTSIHLNRKSAFAGVATRKDALILTLKSGTDLKDPRVVKREQVSAGRWHIELKLERPIDIDGKVKRWLSAAYDLSA